MKRPEETNRRGMSFLDEASLLVKLSQAPERDENRSEFDRLWADLVDNPLRIEVHPDNGVNPLTLPIYVRSPEQIAQSPWLTGSQPVISGRHRENPRELAALPSLDRTRLDAVLGAVAKVGLSIAMLSSNGRQKVAYAEVLGEDISHRDLDLPPPEFLTANQLDQMQTYCSQALIRASGGATTASHCIDRFISQLLTAAFDRRYQFESRALMGVMPRRDSRRLRRYFGRSYQMEPSIQAAVAAIIEDQMAIEARSAGGH
ncbi:MAG: hypothetical protein KC561_12620 [Myxococcales bacterium]|nr:hypothetical protein [Myxococcales bacterium]